MARVIKLFLEKYKATKIFIFFIGLVKFAYHPVQTRPQSFEQEKKVYPMIPV